MTLKHVVLYCGPEYSRLKAKWYPWIFIGSDLGSIIVQAIGGGVAASANHGSVYNKALLDAGDALIIAGIALQSVTMFVCGSLIFDFWMRRRKAIASAAAGERRQQRYEYYYRRQRPQSSRSTALPPLLLGPRLRHTDDSHPLYLPTTGNGGWVGEPADEERDGVLNSGWDDDRVGEHCVDGGASRVVVSADAEGKEGGRGKEEEGVVWEKEEY